MPDTPPTTSDSGLIPGPGGNTWPNQESWMPGSQAFFEYHCYEGEDSTDYLLYQRTHQIVTVISGPYGDDSLEYLPAFQARQKDGLPYTYRVRFPDGHEGDAWEDELMTSPAGYFRHDFIPPR